MPVTPDLRDKRQYNAGYCELVKLHLGQTYERSAVQDGRRDSSGAWRETSPLALWQNLDQRTTAAKAGISERALRNLESGRGSTVETLVRVLKAIGRLDGLEEVLAPEATVDPMLLLRTPTPPQRVRRPRGPRERS